MSEEIQKRCDKTSEEVKNKEKKEESGELNWKIEDFRVYFVRFWLWGRAK